MPPVRFQEHGLKYSNACRNVIYHAGSWEAQVFLRRLSHQDTEITPTTADLMAEIRYDERDKHNLTGPVGNLLQEWNMATCRVGGPEAFARNVAGGASEQGVTLGEAQQHTVTEMLSREIQNNISDSFMHVTYK
jgi:hypothetical protein